jgi:hypothetical protein
VKVLHQEALDALLGLGWLLLVQTKGMKVLLLSQFRPMRALQNPANVISGEHGWAFSRHREEEEKQSRTNGTVRLQTYYSVPVGCGKDVIRKIIVIS